MKLGIKVTAGEEVKWTGVTSQGPTYYGGPPPESGEWKLHIAALEDYFNDHLAGLSFGGTIETFVMGFEIGDLEGWGNFFTPMADYVSIGRNRSW
jgi:hypothetical protein